MDKCKECNNYDNSITHPGTGFCVLHEEYIKNDDNCENYEEK